MPALAAEAIRGAKPMITRPLHHDASPPLWLVERLFDEGAAAFDHEPGPLPHRGPALEAESEERESEAEALAAPFPQPAPALALGFEGVSNRDNRVPPDTVADVGPNHVVQWVNTSFAIWDKQGHLLYGPVNGRTLWNGFGGICETHESGDPIVLYDSLADRWLMSQLAFDIPNNFHQCIAISQTADPTGGWYRYDFLFSNTLLNDYPKFGVWPDGYYMAVNQYDGSDFRQFRGQGAVAYEREQMLVGGPARMIAFDLYTVNPNYSAALPSDLDGPIPPPPGSPNLFVAVDDDSSGFTTFDRMSIWKFHVDWTNVASSTFGVSGNPDYVIDLTAAGFAFDSNLCNYSRSCIPQPGGASAAALSDRLMYRLAYRNFGDHEALVVNHTVDTGADHAGVRWYELRRTGDGAPVLHQAGTYAPDANHRFMGSAAMDGAGNVAVGYSVSSATTFPSIRYAARRPSDPPGTLPLGEGTIADGTGYQAGAARWGDYSLMTIDPVDDCTFWYTQEYYAVTGPFPWQTRIGAFKVDGCGSCPLVGSPTIFVNREDSGTRIAWAPAANADRYDVAEGSLSALLASNGDLAAAARSCPAQALADTSLRIDEPDPAAGDGFWYLIRSASGACRGTYGEAPGRPPDRDVDLADGPCP